MSNIDDIKVSSGDDMTYVLMNATRIVRAIESYMLTCLKADTMDSWKYEALESYYHGRGAYKYGGRGEDMKRALIEVESILYDHDYDYGITDSDLEGIRELFTRAENWYNGKQVLDGVFYKMNIKGDDISGIILTYV